MLSDEDAVLAAYQGYWDTWLAANDPPNPDHPDLERYATGAALAKVQESIASHRSVGQVIRLPSERNSVTSRVVASLDEIAAIVGLLHRRRAGLANGSDGPSDDTVVSQAPPREPAVRGGESADWRRVELEGQWEGVAGCAA